MTRRSIEVASFAHSNPIPAACRIGPLLVSSIIGPRNADDGRVPEGIDAQLANLFHHMGEMLREGGGDWRHVAKVTFYVSDIAHREAINAPWVERFPDPASRPARYTQASGDAGRVLATCEFLAYIED
ncbi:MAG: RidA family protein [Acidimicrobiales bacterium]